MPNSDYSLDPFFSRVPLTIIFHFNIPTTGKKVNMLNKKKLAWRCDRFYQIRSIETILFFISFLGQNLTEWNDFHLREFKIKFQWNQTRRVRWKDPLEIVMQQRPSKNSELFEICSAWRLLVWWIDFSKLKPDWYELSLMFWPIFHYTQWWSLIVKQDSDDGINIRLNTKRLFVCSSRIHFYF